MTENGFLVKINKKGYRVPISIEDAAEKEKKEKLILITEFKGKNDRVIVWRYGINGRGEKDIIAREAELRGNEIIERPGRKDSIFWGEKWADGSWHIKVDKKERGKGYGKMAERMIATIERDNELTEREKGKMSGKWTEEKIRKRRPVIFPDWETRLKGSRHPADKHTKGFMKSKIDGKQVYFRHHLFTGLSIAGAVETIMKKDVSKIPKIHFLGNAERMSKKRARRGKH